MKRLMKNFAVFLCMVCFMGVFGFPAAAEPKAGEGKTGILQYQPEALSWNGEIITVKGSFINTSSNVDILQISSATFTLLDENGGKIMQTTLNAHSLGEVTLAPGEQWSYTVVRTVPGFRAKNYKLDTSFRTACATDISIGSHGNGCSFCSSRGTLTFSTKDTMSQEEWEKSQSEVCDTCQGSGTTTCTWCGGKGKMSAAGTSYPCISCSGTGRMKCLACLGKGTKNTNTGSRKSGAAGTNAGGASANRGNSSGNMAGATAPIVVAPLEMGPGISQITCPVCRGTGRKVCTLCNGYGFRETRKSGVNLGYGNSYYWTKTRCAACNGTGQAMCTHCGGDGSL